ncbi:secreted aspartyl protease [Phycomyces blakesleeanus NRRL 1555(-)]|uniref:Secreted aspartyl protease n=1 Tax=Phycomyces blakesleeanus (strain ATCC 8743b / DSM 1359 / FGSC 10004 / NBRC 33097 / NRRL 1555) TaxID=763407 RepID=A0A162ZK79_PHYB8|nr:secreted aspartyl protease [Phycomyces blakesleeanus NRRL 1555(-)]OAD67371.1 secreted aspartyl protease [Phycomyces blakesleeanus NRRL 1555(-)]|eukprot:XP_018285411.1 secreted aspartyl protease [Phycomyces blakesleeanus NRRL 1555(-)]
MVNIHVFCSLFVAATLATTVATKLLSVPFLAVDRKNSGVTIWGRQRMGNTIGSFLENVDLAYLIDVSFGSSTTWVPTKGCGRYCGYPSHTLNISDSSTFRPSQLVFNIRYGDGFSNGYYAKDTMSLNGVSIPNVHFGVSDFNDGELTMDGADGIMGIGKRQKYPVLLYMFWKLVYSINNSPFTGPDNLTVYNNPYGVIVPTVVTTMHRQKIIDKSIFSIYFHPVDHQDQEIDRINGEITFGGVDMKRVDGNITYMPLTTNTDFQDYWAANIDSISINGKNVSIDDGLSGLLDTGSTLVLLPEPVITGIFSIVRGTRRDYSGQYLVPCTSSDLPSVTLTMGGTDFTLEPKDYVITSGILENGSNFCYTYFQEAPPFVGAILGYGFLQQFVSVYDNEYKRLGLVKRS